MKPHISNTRLATILVLATLLTVCWPAIAQSSSGDCSEASLAQAKADFRLLRAQFLDGDLGELELRDAALKYVGLAEECYAQKFGSDHRGTMIDEGGLWMTENGPATMPPAGDDKYVLFGTKWGAGSSFGGGTDIEGPQIAGGTVTYSFMANGVDLSAESAGLTNTAITSLGTFEDCFLEEIELALGAWSVVADIVFVPVTDGGGPFNTEATGDIRIGAHAFDGASGTLAHAFFPPPNGVTAAGDTHFDLAEDWTCQPESGSIGLGLVALHEFGHAIGLSHETTDLAVMNPFYNDSLIFGLLADDILGAGQIYGEGGAATTTFFGPVGIGTDSPADPLSIVDSDGGFPRLFSMENTGSDFAGFRFTTTGGSIDFNKAGGNTFRLNVVDGDSWELKLQPDGDLVILGQIFTAGSCGAGCDRVFAPEYQLPSIEEHAEEMWRNGYLPTIGPTPEDEQINLSDKTERMLNELEKAHIYIEQLNDGMKALAEQNRQLLQRLEELEAERSKADDTVN